MCVCACLCVCEHLPPGTKVVADLAGKLYTLPASLLTDLRPDLVVHSPGQLHLLELTVCWEANFLSAKLRKESKYLLEQARSVVTQATYLQSRSDAEAVIEESYANWSLRN